MWQSSERAQQEHDEAVKAADIRRQRRAADNPPKVHLSKRQKKRQRRRERAERNGTLIPKPEWTTYAEYLRTLHWKRKRQEAFEFHGRQCQECGSTEDLQVHHTTYRRLGRERLKTLQILCKHCHAIRHENKDDVTLSDPLSEQYRDIIAIA